MKAVYGVNDPMASATEEFGKMVEEIENKHLKQLEVNLTEKCLNPLTLLNSDDIVKMMEKRDKAKMQYEEKNSEVKRLTEQPPKDPTKLPKAKEQNKLLKDEYENVNIELKSLMDDKFALEAEQYDAVMKGVRKKLKFTF